MNENTKISRFFLPLSMFSFVDEECKLGKLDQLNDISICVKRRVLYFFVKNWLSQFFKLMAFLGNDE